MSLAEQMGYKPMTHKQRVIWSVKCGIAVWVTEFVLLPLVMFIKGM